MSTFYYAVNSQDIYVFDNFPSELKTLVFDFKESQKPLEIILEGVKKLARIGRKSNHYGTIYTLTTDEKYVNRYKLFKELLDMSLIALKPLSSFQNDIVQSYNEKTEEFIHNLTSLNSYSIQDLFSLIPQATLSENINKQNDIVKNIISERPNIAVKTLLKLIKYNLAMKVEFSVFEQTLQPYPNAQKLDYSIRDIMLSVLQIFIDDFEHNHIQVSLDACDKRLNVDYDSLFVSLYYILDNSVKYCCPNTKYKIIFKEEKTSFSILFIMISIRINLHEIDKLSKRGYRSELARKLNSDGNGIGMYRILKTLKLNNAELEITPRVNEYTKNIDGIVYEGNQFKVKFLGQQDWFKANMGC